MTDQLVVQGQFGLESVPAAIVGPKLAEMQISEVSSENLITLRMINFT